MLGNPPAHTEDGSGPWEADSKGYRGSWWLRAPAHPNPDCYPGGIWPEGSPALGLAKAACVPTHLPTSLVFLSPRPQEFMAFEFLLSLALPSPQEFMAFHQILIYPHDLLSGHLSQTPPQLASPQRPPGENCITPNLSARQSLW